MAAAKHRSPRHQQQAADSPPGAPATEAPTFVRRHLRFGWWAILIFLTVGLGLEAMHGLKADFYLNNANETRRLMWRLAHAHGVLLGVVNLLFALTAHVASHHGISWNRGASICLMIATVLLPLGFILGGIVIYGADPGRGVLLVPVAAALLFAAVLMVALRMQRW